MAAKRKSLSKKTRFEVFKRDGFTCQYCGRQPPEAILNVDHISPVAKGGGNEITNLVTACRCCNAGKGARQLSDKSIVKAQAQELARQQERVEQLKMMHEWSLAQLSEKDQAIDQLSEYWEQVTGGWGLTGSGRADLSKVLKKFGYAALVKATDTSIERYGRWDEDGSLFKYSVEECLSKLHGICSFQRQDEDLPGFSRTPYIVAIVQNRFRCRDKAPVYELLKEALQVGIEVEHLELCAKRAEDWDTWTSWIDQLVSEADDA